MATHRFMQCEGPEKQARQPMQDLSGRLSVGEAGDGAGVKRRMRGPIRRRPYNRGEIVSKKCGQLVEFNDFY